MYVDGSTTIESSSFKSYFNLSIFSPDLFAVTITISSYYTGGIVDVITISSSVISNLTPPEHKFMTSVNVGSIFASSLYVMTVTQGSYSDSGVILKAG
jgi:hypothetical protein